MDEIEPTQLSILSRDYYRLTIVEGKKADKSPDVMNENVPIRSFFKESLGKRGF